MAQAVSIVLADALATPVNHTFLPIGPQKDGFFAFEDQSASTPLGFNRIEIRGRRTGTMNGNAGQRSWRVDLRIKTPKLETLSTNDAGMVPPPRVAYVPAVEVSFVTSDRGNLQDRKDIRKYVANLLGNVQVVDLIESQIPTW
jgi:hypothetical protein